VYAHNLSNTFTGYLAIESKFQRMNYSVFEKL